MQKVLGASVDATWIWTAGEDRKPVQFSFFRKTFTCAAARRARVLCTADSKYRLWVNGKPVGFGPARGHPEHPYYDTHSVALRKGRNTVAAVVEHYTVGAHIFAVVEGGFWCRVEAEGRTLARTDGTWKATPAQGRSAMAGTIFPERFDARLEPAGWEQPGFDDGGWPAAMERKATRLAPPAQMKPRPIPLLTEKRLTPVRMLDAGTCEDAELKDWGDESDISGSLWRMKLKPEPGLPRAWSGQGHAARVEPGKAAYVMLDFGMETLAAPEVRLRGAAGVIVDLAYSECLWNNRVATTWQSPRLKQAERIILREGVTEHRLMQPRGFRYMLLRIANPTQGASRVAVESVAAYEMVYPTRARGAFACSDDVLNRTFALSARTVNLCMEDAYTDCPWRERSQWVGDAQPETLFSYFAFGAYDLARKAVIEFTSGNTAEGWIPGVFPTSDPKNLPTWGMRVPVIAWEYYLYSGDESVLARAFAGVKKQMEWFARHTDANGLVVDMKGWNFVDWTRADDRHADGAVQGWYLESLEYAAKLAKAAGDAGACADYLGRAARLRKSLARLYWSPAKGAFRKYRPGSPEPLPSTDPELLGQHENFLFSLLGVGTAAQRRRALDAMRGPSGRYLPSLGDYQSAFVSDHKGNYVGEEVLRIGSPFWSYYALLALMESGRVPSALEYIRTCWGMMLDYGATSCWEMWDRHTSLCHGWSAAPAMILPAYVLGVKPLRPGFRVFEARPRAGGLTWAKGRVPAPGGVIGVSWRREETGWRGEIVVPSGLEGRFVWDARSNGKAKSVLLNGRRAALRFGLPAGRHVIEVELEKRA